MSPVLPLRRAVVLLLAAVALLTACGPDDTGTVTIGKSSAGSTTTVAPDTGSDPLAPDDTVDEPGDGDSPTTTAGSETDAGGGDAGAGPSTGAADQDAVDVSWTSSPGEYRGQDGLRVAYTCPPGGTIASLWGTGPFTDDSSVCTAGVFLGLITPEGGGRIVIEIAPGESAYPGAEAHGVTAAEYGTWAGSFEVVPSDG